MSHYETLGVPRDADAAAIKKAYRKLASEHHSDKGGDDAKMAEINVAYQVLSDPDKRAMYDSGKAGVTDLEQAAQSELAQMFSQYLEAGGNGDPLPHMSVGIVQTINNAERQIKALKDKEQRLKKIAKRLSTKSGAINLYEGVINGHLSAINKNISDLKSHIEIGQRMKEMLTDYEYQADEPEQALIGVHLGLYSAT